MRGLKQRRPVRSCEELDDRDLLEELEGRHKEGDHDPDRRDDGDQRANEEESLDDVLAVASPLGAELRRRAGGQVS